MGRLRTRIKTGLVYLRGGRPLEWYVRRGLGVGDRTDLQYPFSLDPDHCWLIDIGDDVVFAPGVTVLAHDASTMEQLGFTRIGRVCIGDRVFVGQAALILPGTTIGPDTVIGAGSVVTSDIPAGSIAAGNPARVISTQEDYLRRQRELLDAGPAFGEEWTTRQQLKPSMKRAMRAKLEQGPGFVR
jgi:maltose O-acetyltransferase